MLIDGLSQQRSENGSSFDEEAPSVDALQQLTVTEALPSAEYNRTTGGFENFVTKSGTSKFHGYGYEILRNTALDANLWFNGGNRDSAMLRSQRYAKLPRDLRHACGPQERLWRYVQRPGLDTEDLQRPRQNLFLLCLGAAEIQPRCHHHHHRAYCAGTVRRFFQPCNFQSKSSNRRGNQPL